MWLNCDLTILATSSTRTQWKAAAISNMGTGQKRNYYLLSDEDKIGKPALPWAGVVNFPVKRSAPVAGTRGTVGG